MSLYIATQNCVCVIRQRAVMMEKEITSWVCISSAFLCVPFANMSSFALRVSQYGGEVKEADQS